MKLTFLPIRAFAPILFLTAFLGFASPASADHCGNFSHEQVTERQYTDLHCAARTNDATRVDELIRAGADVNVRDTTQVTPLSAAAFNNADKTTALLIRAGANVNAGDENQWTPLHYAARGNADKVTALLIRAGADVNAQTSNIFETTPLTQSSGEVERLIRNPQEAIALANKIDPPPTGEEAAKIAREVKKRKAESERQAAEVARLESERQEAERQAQEAAIAAAENSLQEESEPAVSDPSPERGTSAAVAFAESLRAQKSESPAAAPPETALPQAAPQAANPAQAQIVVDGACDLCDAVKLGDAEIIALLLQAGHDPNARDASGKTVLSYAIQSQRVDIVRMLTKGVDAPPPPPRSAAATRSAAAARPRRIAHRRGGFRLGTRPIRRFAGRMARIRRGRIRGRQIRRHRQSGIARNHRRIISPPPHGFAFCRRPQRHCASGNAFARGRESQRANRSRFHALNVCRKKEQFGDCQNAVGLRRESEIARTQPQKRVGLCARRKRLRHPRNDKKMAILAISESALSGDKIQKLEQSETA